MSPAASVGSLSLLTAPGGTILTLSSWKMNKTHFPTAQGRAAELKDSLAPKSSCLGAILAINSSLHFSPYFYRWNPDGFLMQSWQCWEQIPNTVLKLRESQRSWGLPLISPSTRDSIKSGFHHRGHDFPPWWQWQEGPSCKPSTFPWAPELELPPQQFLWGSITVNSHLYI